MKVLVLTKERVYRLCVEKMFDKAVGEGSVRLVADRQIRYDGEQQEYLLFTAVGGDLDSLSLKIGKDDLGFGDIEPA